MKAGAFLRVVDLYAGIGGWSVGFKLAGFEVLKSYEWWEPAARTHEANGSSDVAIADIRQLNLTSLPVDVDVVVGSPPCTQFSYSNRGGSGDIADGLVDLERFLAIVKHLKPKAWAFENVPRVKNVIERELSKGGALEQYKNLFKDAQIEIFDMANFGVPQRRKRCIAGNFDFGLLRSYHSVMEQPTLGDVVGALQQGRDPIFQTSSKFVIHDNDPEEPLNWEEERFNRDMKEAHPVYNGMPFPDPLDRSSRTITATCTRVSRESLIIREPNGASFRRLSVRERASLQSFPVKFQFLGKSHAQKLKMIGNAIPPVFTYLIAEAIKGTDASCLRLPSEIDANALIPEGEGVKTLPDNSGRTYPEDRRFRFSIPNLRFKSGTRFELSNVEGQDRWHVAFFFGDSKRIHNRTFTQDAIETAITNSPKHIADQVCKTQRHFMDKVDLNGLDALQATWSHRSQGLHPFELIDRLGQFVDQELEQGKWSCLADSDLKIFVHNIIFDQYQAENFAVQKISRYLRQIAIGSVVASLVNCKLFETRQKILSTV